MSLGEGVDLSVSQSVQCNRYGGRDGTAPAGGGCLSSRAGGGVSTICGEEGITAEHFTKGGGMLF